jgi:hypothetical protein
VERAHADLGPVGGAKVHGYVPLVVPARQLRVDGEAVVILEEVVDGELHLAQGDHARASHDRNGQVPAGDMGSNAAAPPREAAGEGESLNVGRIDFEQAKDVKVGVGNDLLLPRPSARAADAPEVQQPKAKGGRGQHAPSITDYGTLWPVFT